MTHGPHNSIMAVISMRLTRPSLFKSAFREHAVVGISVDVADREDLVVVDFVSNAVVDVEPDVRVPM